MSAGTVISGGFPGRYAQEVQPNQKCSGCLHYDGQGGRTGVCTIGLKPWTCGEGQAPQVSYAPIARGAGSYLPDMSNHGAHAPAVDGQQDVGGLYGAGSTRPVEIKQVSLGEEHVHIVKSMVERHAQLQKSQCRMCSMRGTHGTAPPNVEAQACSCAPLQAQVVAKAVVSGMSNAQRAGVRFGDVVEWVRGVARAGFRLPAQAGPGAVVKSVAELSLADRVRIDDNGGHLRLRKATPPAPKAEDELEDVSKSFYGDDWIGQFKGTPLFDAARKLCEQELSIAEDDLKRREARMERDKQRSEALEKINAKTNSAVVDTDWQEQDVKREKMRIAKQRLTLKLVALQQGVSKGRPVDPNSPPPKLLHPDYVDGTSTKKPKESKSKPVRPAWVYGDSKPGK